MTTEPQDVVKDVRSYLHFLHSVSDTYIRWQEDSEAFKNAIRHYAMWLLSSEDEVRTTDMDCELVAAWHLHRFCTHYGSWTAGKNIRVNLAQLNHTFPDKILLHISDDLLPHTEVGNLTRSLADLLCMVISFNGKVQLPHFSDRIFLEKAARRLNHFMMLCRQHKDQQLVPTLDILLVLLSRVFCRPELIEGITEIIDLYDLMRRAGMNDVTPTTALWLHEIRTPYLIPGSQWFQGDIPMGNVPPDRLRPEEGAVYELTIDNLCVEEIWNNERGVVIEARRLGESSFSYQSLFRVKGQVGNNIKIKPNYDWGKTLFDLTKHRALEFHMYGWKGRCCRSYEEHISTIMFDPRKIFTAVNKDKHSEKIELPRIYKSDPKVTFDCSWVLRKSSPPSMFSLLRNPFSVGPLPVDLLTFVEGLPSWDGADIRNPEIFITAQHGLHLRRSDTNLAIQVVCHTRAPLAGLLLYDQREGLLAAAHVINDDILPHALQVGSDCRLTIEPDTDACAMMVYSRHGPWAVLTMSCDPVTDQGSYRLYCYNIQTHTEQDCLLNFSEQHVFTLGDVTVDLQTGRTTVSPGSPHVAESLVTGFCVGILYVLLYEIKNVHARSIGSPSPKTIPRQLRSKMERNETLKSNKGSLTLSKLKKTQRRKRSLVCTMLLACGLEQTVRPTFYGSTLEKVSFYSSTMSLGLLHPYDDKSLPRTKSSVPSGSNSPRMSEGSMSLGIDINAFSMDNGISYSAKKGIINPIYDPTGDSFDTPTESHDSQYDSHEYGYQAENVSPDLTDATDIRHEDSGASSLSRPVTPVITTRDLTPEVHKPKPRRKSELGHIEQLNKIDDFINSVFEPLSVSDLETSEFVAKQQESLEAESMSSWKPRILLDMDDIRPDSAFGSEADDNLNETEIVFVEHM